MFPFIFDWTWDISHIVFMGGLWYAISIIGAGLTFAIVKSLFDIYGDHDSHGSGHH